MRVVEKQSFVATFIRINIMNMEQYINQLVEERLQSILDQMSEEEKHKLANAPPLHLQTISINYAKELLSSIKPKRDFIFRRKIIYGIRSQFDLLTTFKLVEAWNPQDTNEGKITWNIIQTYRPGLISIGTVIYYAKQEGYTHGK